MKRVLRTTIMALLALVLCINVLAPTAQAAENSVTANLNVTINSEVVPPVDEVQLVLTAVTPNAPMPGEGSVYTATREIKEDVVHVSLPIEFTRVGVYEYTLKQVPTNKYGYTDIYKAHYANYDTKEYNIKLTVFNEFDNNSQWVGLNVASYVEIDGVPNGESKPELEFDNTYAQPTSVKVLKQWVGGTGSPIEVSLMNGDKVIETVELNKDNQWTHTWNGLNSTFNWTVKETKGAPGFTATTGYNEITGVWVITNSASLLQTGQLNWPIPVLAAGGMILVAVGYMLLRKKEETNA